MRYTDGAPKGVIDYLLIECMLWGKAQGFQWFNLGMAPLAGLEEHALAPTWHKLGRWCSATARCSITSRACENTKRSFCRCGVRAIWLHPMASPPPAHCSTSLR